MEHTTDGMESEVRALYDQHAAGLLRYAAMLLRDRDGAHDAVQETFLRYFIERSYGRSIDNPRAWLYCVLRHYAMDRLKSAEARRETSPNDIERVADARQNPEERLQHSEMASEIATSLSGREWDCLRLRGEGLGYAEIGEVLEIRTGTVSALLARAYKKIRRAAQCGEAVTQRTAAAIRLLLIREGKNYSS